MFKKRLIANRGGRAAGAGVRSYAQSACERAPKCTAGAARQGDRAA